MHSIKINNKFIFETNNNSAEILLNGQEINLNITFIDNLNWHIINKLKSYNVEIISINKEEKTAQIRINNNLYNLSAKDQFDLLLDNLGLSNLNNIKVSEVKAPMPGLVLNVFVTEGSSVKKGDNLFVLEAMKMENIIKAVADVIIKSVKIKPGDKVEKNQVLMLF